LKDLKNVWGAAGKTAAAARTGAGFGARLFHHDGRGERESFARREGGAAGQRKLTTRLAKGEIFSRIDGRAPETVPRYSAISKSWTRMGFS
jgi:hypothetical protein